MCMLIKVETQTLEASKVVTTGLFTIHKRSRLQQQIFARLLIFVRFYLYSSLCVSY